MSLKIDHGTQAIRRTWKKSKTRSIGLIQRFQNTTNGTTATRIPSRIGFLFGNESASFAPNDINVNVNLKVTEKKKNIFINYLSYKTITTNTARIEEKWWEGVGSVNGALLLYFFCLASTYVSYCWKLYLKNLVPFAGISWVISCSKFCIVRALKRSYFFLFLEACLIVWKTGRKTTE